jgi:hypothetical protein
MEGAKEHERAAGGGINVRVAAWLAWAFVALSVALFIASGVLYVRPQLSETPSCRESSSGSVVGVWQA